MTTDTALGVVKMVVVDKSESENLVFLSSFDLLSFFEADSFSSLVSVSPCTVPLEKIEYREFPTIHFNSQESVEMPFREYFHLLLESSPSRFAFLNIPVRFAVATSLLSLFNLRLFSLNSDPLFFISSLAGYIKGPDGEPLLPVGMREHLRKDLDRSFEF